MSRREIRRAQQLLNAFFRDRKLGYKPLPLDGELGPMTRRRAKLARFYLALGGSVITSALLQTLKDPRRRAGGSSRAEHLRRLRLMRKRLRGRRRRLKKKRKKKQIKGTSPGPPHWGGSRYIVEETHPIARRHGAPLTSTKRAASHPLSRSNPGSDHNTANVTAYAHDYATFRGAGLAVAIRRHYGNYSRAVGTYAAYYVKRGGRTYRLQTLWAVKGHHDHSHHGARR